MNKQELIKELKGLLTSDDLLHFFDLEDLTIETIKLHIENRKGEK